MRNQQLEAVMSNASQSPSIDGSWISSSPLPWLTSYLSLTIFLAAATAFVFFSEHDISMSKSLTFVAEIEDQESWVAGGNKMRQIGFLSFAAVGAISLLLGRVGKFRLNLPVALIALYIIWAGLSTQWSIDSGTTMRRCVLILCCVIGCFGFSRFLRVQDVVFAALMVSLAYLMLGVTMELFYGSFRPHSSGYRFAGTMHPNMQAANLAMGAIAAWVMAKIRPQAKAIFLGLFGLLFLFLIVTKCRSATGTVPVALGVIWLASQPSKNVFIGVLAGFWLIASAGLICMVSGFDPIDQYQEVLLMGRGEETGSSLTGRLPLWQDLTEYISRRPWKGHGYRAFWNPRHIYEIAVSQQWVISEAHSSYVDATLQLGLIGCILFVLTEICTLFYAAILFRRTKRPAYLFLVGGVVFCIARGLTESGMSDPNAPTAFLFLALAAHCWSGNWNSKNPQPERAQAIS